MVADKFTDVSASVCMSIHVRTYTKYRIVGFCRG